MKRIYLDHAATTYLDPRVEKSMQPYWQKAFGNPSSIYEEGLDARKALEQARQAIAEVFNCLPQEIIFTAGGTESDNLAIFGIYNSFKKNNPNVVPHFITSQIEHHAVLYPFESLEKNKLAEVTYLPVDEQGLIDIDGLKKAIKENTILISIMYANNEIGTIEPISEIAQTIKGANSARNNKIVFHTDACQAAGALDLDVQKLGIDLLTANGSKIYGPKQIGILFKKKGIKIEPQILGGGQEYNLRSGTENVSSIVGLSVALKLAQKNRDRENKRLITLRDWFIATIIKEIPKAYLNGTVEKRLPNNINISFDKIEGEALVLLLDHEGIACGTGSACNSKSLEPSHVITALGYPEERGHSSIRFTLGKKTTKQDLIYTLKYLKKHVAYLRSISAIN